MTWFRFLKSEGYFDPEQNPDPVNGDSNPYWDALGYLEQLSRQICEGKNTELIDDLLLIIRNVSQNPKDNSVTWYLIIKILCNIPASRIPIEILSFIPIWLSGKHDTMIQTAEICDNLLPKFLNADPAPDDIIKAETIISLIFQIERAKCDFTDMEEVPYQSRLYLHFLVDRFKKNKIIEKIARYCSSGIILDLGRKLKFLLLDQPPFITDLLSNEHNDVKVKVKIDGGNLLILSILPNQWTLLSTIENWEQRERLELGQLLISTLQESDISYGLDDNELLKRMDYALNVDRLSSFNYVKIKDLGERYFNSQNLYNVYAHIFREILFEIAKIHPEEGLKVMEIICLDSKYKIPFFRRLSLYIIARNWNSTKSLFWRLLQEDGPFHLFSSYIYWDELYELLNSNQYSLTTEELDTIGKIIQQGITTEDENASENVSQEWTLGWYSALRYTEPFKSKYASLSKSLGIDHSRFEQMGNINMELRNSNISQISQDDILEKTNGEIVHLLRTFTQKQVYSEISVRGLADTLFSTVECNPDYFTKELHLYLNVNYIYVSRIIDGFTSAWQNHKTLDWESVLLFCQGLIERVSIIHSSNTSAHEVDSQWDQVSDSIAGLIIEGTKEDENSFSMDLLPLAKRIVHFIVSDLKPSNDLIQSGLDYRTYFLNSNAAKSLKALLDYSLHRARNIENPEEMEKWEIDIRSLLESTGRKGVIETFLLEGMYLEQFRYLDNEWIINQIEGLYNSDEDKWLSFMGGLLCSRPSRDAELYKILRRHYMRLLGNDILVGDLNNNRLVDHLSAFYFWNFETLSPNNLLFEYIEKASIEQLTLLINFISLQKGYPNTLSATELEKFQSCLFVLWNYLTVKFYNSKTEEKLIPLSQLCQWIAFVPKLDELYTDLLVKCCKHIERSHLAGNVLQDLNSLIPRGDPNTTAQSIGKIVLSISFNYYMSDREKDHLRNIVLFLIQQGHRGSALKICNKMAADHQLYFLREIYDANS